MKDISQLKAETRVELRRLGLASRKVKGTGWQVWHYTNREVEAYFAPAFFRKSGGFQVLGVLGLHIPDFENHWIGLLKENFADAEKADVTLFGIYITNFRKFIDPPYLENIPQLEGWISEIVNFMAQFPADIDSLSRQLCYGRIGTYEARLFFGSRTKWLAFVVWLKDRGLVIPPEVISSNTKKPELHLLALYEDMLRRI